MHKITAALLSAFVSVKRVGANIAARIHAFLIDLHIANLRTLVTKAENRVKRLLGVAEYHKAAAIEATTVADGAQRKADAVTASVATQVSTLGVNQ